MREIMLMYHPVKKEIHFLVNNNGEYNEIPYIECPRLQKYGPDQGEFLLQNQGNQFFDDIVETFLAIENSKIIFKGTRIDYEDFVNMISDYNKCRKKEILKLGNFIELPDVSIIYEDIIKVYNDTVNIFDKKLQDLNIKKIYEDRKKDLNEKIKVLDENNVNLCMVGTYSSGKSSFINAIIGKRILPESINSETAKMFKIKNSKCPSINFIIKKDKVDNGVLSSIVWDELNKIFTFTAYTNDDGIKGKVDLEINNSRGLMQHEQLHNILKVLNDLPNGSKDDDKNYLDGIIEVNYPIPLCENINFTFFDTPGTDSNSSEHLNVLKDALKKQTNSILIILYSPVKMEGAGNSILYELLNESQNDSEKEGNVTIDLARSIHVINQVDRYGTKEIKATRDKKIKTSLNKIDEISDDISEYEYDLRKKRVFYVSSKGAYCAKAGLQNILDEDDEEFIEDSSNKIINKRYFQYDNLAESIIETDELKISSERELEYCNTINDENERNYKRLYVASGMYAIEEEIVKYAKKYALAVKAKALYDGVDKLINGVYGQYDLIENQASKDKQELENQISIMKTKIIADINEVYDNFESYLTKENMERQIIEIENLRTKVGNLNVKASKRVINKMPKISLNPEVFAEKNKIINKMLNEYASDLDRYYKESRIEILNRQMNSLKKIISEKIINYKGIDKKIIEQILGISDTLIPQSTLSPLRIQEYINEEKAFFFFTTTDKAKYKERLQKEFYNLTNTQYDYYIKEVVFIAKDKGKEMKQRFIDNIENISATLEKLIIDKKKVSYQQEQAKRVLDIVSQKYTELDKKIWRDINE